MQCPIDRNFIVAVRIQWPQQLSALLANSILALSLNTLELFTSANLVVAVPPPYSFLLIEVFVVFFV